MSEEKLITIVVEGGCVVDVHGMPKGYLYALEDHDVEEDEEEEIEEEREQHINESYEVVGNQFILYYRCETCMVEWVDCYEAEVNGRCPKCRDKNISPFKVEDAG